jgi:hypothetical protein
MPNGYLQGFVIGTNQDVYTRWSTSSGLSGWVSLHGQCYVGPGSIALWTVIPSNGWDWTIQCTGGDGRQWYDQRTQTSGTNGFWSGWYK